MVYRSEKTSTGSVASALLAAAFTFVLFLALISPAGAVPSYARQTGQECIACHVSFPELTPYGRRWTKADSVTMFDDFSYVSGANR